MSSRLSRLQMACAAASLLVTVLHAAPPAAVAPDGIRISVTLVIPE